MCFLTQIKLFLYFYELSCFEQGFFFVILQSICMALQYVDSLKHTLFTIITYI